MDLLDFFMEFKYLVYYYYLVIMVTFNLSKGHIITDSKAAITKPAEILCKPSYYCKYYSGICF